MDLARIFHKLHLKDNKKAQKVRRFHWQRHGEEFTRNGHTVTELEVQTHHRLSAQSQVERLSS